LLPPPPPLQECLPSSQLQCSAVRANPTAKSSKLMAGPCLTSAKGAVRVWATARSEDFAKGGVVQAAASAVDGTGPPIVSACSAMQ
jgi:hypothetical protein